MKSTIDTINGSVTDPIFNNLINSPPTNVGYKLGAGQLFKVEATYTYTGQSTSLSTVSVPIWVAPTRKYILLDVVVRLSANLVTTGSPGNLTSLKVLDTAHPASLIDSAGGTFTSNTYSVSGANKVIWTMSGDQPAASGGAGNQLFYNKGGKYVNADSTAGISYNLAITTDVTTWTMSSGIATVSFLGMFLS